MSGETKVGGRLLAALLTTLFVTVVLRSAWIHDDAYITYRTVDNFINGYGLRWNPAERVQTYTHPLWLFVVATSYLVTHEVFFTVIFISIALSLATVLLLVFGVASSLAAGCYGVAVLICSKAFVDYSTSGLENPLTHFVFASFLVVYFRRETRLTTLYLLASLAAFGALNRMDTLVLYLPVLVYTLLKVRRARGLAVVAAGFLPLVLWEAFSLFYYGFLFPNTAYAKVFDTGVARGDLAMHGMYYLLNSARTDPVTLLAISSGVAVGLWSRDQRDLPVVGGIAAYLLYVVLIGGDFVSGRFLTAPLLGAVVLLSRWAPVSRTAVVVATIVVILVGIRSSDRPSVRTAAAGSRVQTLMDAHGIADERAYYYPYAGFVRALQHVPLSSHPWAREGLEARRNGVPLVIRSDIGYFGFYAGPHVHIVDLWGLADPLIARLPAKTDVSWRVGHFTRAIPAGYIETLTSGENKIADKSLAAYYDRLALITRGHLFDRSRLLEIWKMNVGNGSQIPIPR
jgi:arabinofuranosyltransferase